MPLTITNVVITMGRSRDPAPASAAASASMPSSRERAAKVQSKIALATEIPTAIIAPMNDWMLRVEAVTEQRHTDAHQDGGECHDHRKSNPTRLKIGDEQKEDGNDRQNYAELQIRDHLGQWGELTADADADPPRRFGKASQRLLHRGARASQVGVVNVRRDRDHALHVAAVILAERLADTEIGHIPQQRRQSPAGMLHRYRCDVVDRVGLCLGHLDLNLIGDPAARIGPVDRSCETARPGNRGESPADVRDADIELRGSVAIDGDIQSRILEQLSELHVPQFPFVCERLLDRFGVLAVGVERKPRSPRSRSGSESRSSSPDSPGRQLRKSRWRRASPGAGAPEVVLEARRWTPRCPRPPAPGGRPRADRRSRER